MDWKIVATTFAAVFVAELGDKTQLLTFGASSATPDRLSVFVGSATALVAASAIGVLLGATLGRFVSPLLLERLGGIVFLVIGIAVLWRSFFAR